MLQQYHSLPRGHFPLLPTNTPWTLYEDVTINSKGFASQPHFASTVNSIIGRALNRAIADLGSWRQNTSYAMDMKAYTAVSPVRAAHDSMLTDMLAPTFFLAMRTHGPQNF
eukprot:6878874-Karenia_brevis.AAC.1